jgi:hypothetical protein
MSCGLVPNVSALCGDGDDDDDGVRAARTDPELVGMLTPLNATAQPLGSPRGNNNNTNREGGDNNNKDEDDDEQLLSTETPAIVIEFAQLLTSRNMLSYVDLRRVALRAHLRVQESRVRQNKISTVQQMRLVVDGSDQSPADWWRQFNDQRLSLPFALSVSLLGYNASKMPIDTQISLRGMRTMYERRMGSRNSGDSLLRDHILIGRHAAARPSRGGQAFSMLTRPLVCHEPLTGMRFGSIEAVGFDEALFWRDYARPVTDQARVARLFSRTHDRDMLSSPSSAPFYLVELSYRYTALLMRVHAYLTLQQMRRESVYEIDEQSVDPACYQVPNDSNHVIFDASSLNAAVRFVVDRLVDVHPSFHPSDLSVTLEPFAYASWTDAWQALDNRQASLADADRVNNNYLQRSVGVHDRTAGAAADDSQRYYEIEAAFVIYFAVFDRSRLPPTMEARPNPHMTTEQFNAFIGLNNAADDSETQHYSMSSTDSALTAVRARQAQQALHDLAPAEDQQSTTVSSTDDDETVHESSSVDGATASERAVRRQQSQPIPVPNAAPADNNYESGGSNDYGSWRVMAPAIYQPQPTAGDDDATQEDTEHRSVPSRAHSAALHATEAVSVDRAAVLRTRSYSVSLTTKSDDDDDNDDADDGNKRKTSDGDADESRTERLRRLTMFVSPARAKLPSVESNSSATVVDNSYPPTNNSTPATTPFFPRRQLVGTPPPIPSDDDLTVSEGSPKAVFALDDRSASGESAPAPATVPDQ